MKLWELFDKKYIGRKVEWVDTHGEKHKGHVGTNTYDSVYVFEDDKIGAMTLSQHDMQVIDFELMPNELSFEELQEHDLYGTSIKFVYGDIIKSSMVFSTIIKELTCELSSNDLIKTILNGKWYILSE